MGHAPSARDRFRQVKDYACYYGAGRLDDLAKFDLVILEPDQHRPEDVAWLRAQGVVVIGYVSVGQADTLEVGDGRGPGGMASWYLDRATEQGDALIPGPDGEPDRDPEWGAYWVDLTSTAWQQRIDRRVARVLREWGADGVFLDTILYDTVYEGDYRQTVVPAHLTRWLKRLRGRHRQAVVIANNGWTYLKPLGPLVDGIMLEDFSGRYAAHEPEARAYYDGIARDVVEYRAAQRTRPLVVLAMDYAKPDDVGFILEARRHAQQYGFLHSVSSKNLEGIELYVLATVNPARTLRAVRQGESVTLTWEAHRLHCQESGVDRFVLKRSEMSITTDEDWKAATLVSDELSPQQPYYVDERAPASAQWYALGALHGSGAELIGHVTAKVEARHD
jgi:endo-alpha-1,4-polygalactosaminidase (GH114 family)